MLSRPSVKKRSRQVNRISVIIVRGARIGGVIAVQVSSEIYIVRPPNAPDVGVCVDVLFVFESYFVNSLGW